MNQESNRLDSLHFETLAKSTASLDLNKRCAIILGSGFACRDCFTILENAIVSIDSSVPIYLALSTTSTSLVDRKLQVEAFKSIVRTRRFLFDYVPRGDVDTLGHHIGGVMGRFGVRITPCLLIVGDDGRYTFIDYADLFGASIDSDAGINDVRAVIIEKSGLPRHSNR